MIIGYSNKKYRNWIALTEFGVNNMVSKYVQIIFLRWLEAEIFNFDLNKTIYEQLRFSKNEFTLNGTCRYICSEHRYMSRPWSSVLASDNSILVKDRIHYWENKMPFLTFCNENITRQRLEMICLFKFVLIQIVRYYSLTKIRRLIDDDYESFFSFSSQNPPKGPSENKTIEFH